MKKHRFILSLILCSICLFTQNPQISANESGPAVPDEWTVEDAVRFAIANSPDTAVARQRINAAHAAVQQAQAAFYPQLDLGASYAQTDNPMHSFGNILNQGVFDQSIDFNEKL